MDSQLEPRYSSAPPEFTPKAMLNYRLFMLAHLRRFNRADLALETDRPERDEAHYSTLLGPQGGETPASRNYNRQLEEDTRLWDRRNDVAYAALVDSIRKDDSAVLLLQELNTFSAKLLWNRLFEKFDLQFTSVKQKATAKFNSMVIFPNEDLSSFVTRLKAAKLMLLNLGITVNDDVDMLGRLKAGIAKDEKLKHVFNFLHFQPNLTWTSVVQSVDSYGSLTEPDPQITLTPSKDKAETAAYTVSKNQAHRAKARFMKASNGTNGIGRRNGEGGDRGFNGCCNYCGIRGHKKSDCRKLKQFIKSNPNAAAQFGIPKVGTTDGGATQSFQSSRPETMCFICHKPGHVAKDCRNQQKRVSFERGYVLIDMEDSTNQSSGSQRHPNIVSDDNIRRSQVIDLAGDTESSCAISEHEFDAVLDSGSSSHMLRGDAVTENLQSHIYADASVINTAKAGSQIKSDMRINVGHIDHGVVVDSDELMSNLISVAKLDSRGCRIVFENGSGTVYGKDGSVISRAVLQGNIYKCDLRDFTNSEVALIGSVAPKESITLWHRRLGHRNLRDLQYAIDVPLLKGPSRFMKKLKKNDEPLCPDCARAKSTRFHFRKRKCSQDKFDDSVLPSSTSDLLNNFNEDSDGEECVDFQSDTIPRVLTKVIDQISTDIKGPFNIPARSGEVYYQGFIEKHTKWLYDYYMNTRDQALDNIKHLVEVEFTRLVLTLRSYHADGALELVSKKLINYLSSKGVYVTYSPPYTPELNAIIERSHRTIFESAYAMLLHSGLPDEFWIFAVKYAVAIYNRLPTNTAYGYMSPFEARYGEIPVLDRFKTFGCICYAHIHQQERIKGFVDKSYRGNFLGIDPATNL
jgi:hypothetical protein